MPQHMFAAARERLSPSRPRAPPQLSHARWEISRAGSKCLQPRSSSCAAQGPETRWLSCSVLLFMPGGRVASLTTNRSACPTEGVTRRLRRALRSRTLLGNAAESAHEAANGSSITLPRHSFNGVSVGRRDSPPAPPRLVHPRLVASALTPWSQQVRARWRERPRGVVYCARGASADEAHSSFDAAVALLLAPRRQRRSRGMPPRDREAGGGQRARLCASAAPLRLHRATRPFHSLRPARDVPFLLARGSRYLERIENRVSSPQAFDKQTGKRLDSLDGWPDCYVGDVELGVACDGSEGAGPRVRAAA